MPRLLLILALLWSPLTLNAIGAPQGVPPGAPPECHPTGCCPVVAVKACCAQRVVKHHCGNDVGCICGLEPGDSEPVPEAPMPRPGNEIGLVFLNTAAALVAVQPEPSRVLRGADPVLRTTHNRTRALLGIWRM